MDSPEPHIDSEDFANVVGGETGYVIDPLSVNIIKDGRFNISNYFFLQNIKIFKTILFITVCSDAFIYLYCY